MQAKYQPATGWRRSTRAFAPLSPILLIITSLVGCAGIGRAPAPAAIIVSDRITAYKQVADALGARFPEAVVYPLDGDARNAERLIAKLRPDAGFPVIAIGSLATRAAIKLPDRLVIFCQDFYREHTPLADGSVRGVSAIPPAFKQLRAWRMVDPQLRRVTMISGGGMEELVREAASAARRLQMQLDHVEVQSDRELLYVVKRLDPDVQGVWFAPDHRVLSVAALRETLAHNLRYGRQSLVFSPQLLGFGALLSVESEPHDIAERVLEQLYATQAEAPALAPLQRARARVNSEIAKQLGLAVPAAMQGGSYVF